MSAKQDQIIKRQIERAEDEFLTETDNLRRRLIAAQEAIAADQRVSASVSGDPFIVETALRIDAAIRARQQAYDTQLLDLDPPTGYGDGSMDKIDWGHFVTSGMSWAEYEADQARQNEED